MWFSWWIFDYKLINLCCILKDPKTYNNSSTLKDQLHKSSNMITTRRPSSDYGKLPCREEVSRKSPPATTLNHHQRPFPYSTRGSLRKVLVSFIYCEPYTLIVQTNTCMLERNWVADPQLFINAGNRESEDKPCSE